MIMPRDDLELLSTLLEYGQSAPRTTAPGQLLPGNSAVRHRFHGSTAYRYRLHDNVAEELSDHVAGCTAPSRYFQPACVSRPAAIALECEVERVFYAMSLEMRGEVLPRGTTSCGIPTEKNGLPPAVAGVSERPRPLATAARR